MFIKTLSFTLRTRWEQRSLRDTAAAVSFFQPLKLCYLQSNGTKADSKKDKVRDGNPFSIHYAQPVDRGGASLQFKYPPQTFCEQLLHFSIRNPHLSIRSNNLLRLDETLMIPVGRNGSMRRSGKVKWLENTLNFIQEKEHIEHNRTNRTLKSRSSVGLPCDGWNLWHQTGWI